MTKESEIGIQPLFGVVANVKDDRVLRTGAKVWINFCNGDASCPFVTGMSKWGRYVQKYSNYKRLTNFRAAWIPQHMRDRVMWAWPEKEKAAEMARNISEKNTLSASENKCDRCQVSDAEAPHECPYAQENGSNEYCTCCSACRHQCAMDI